MLGNSKHRSNLLSDPRFVTVCQIGGPLAFATSRDKWESVTHPKSYDRMRFGFTAATTRVEQRSEKKSNAHHLLLPAPRCFGCDCFLCADSPIHQHRPFGNSSLPRQNIPTTS